MFRLALSLLTTVLVMLPATANADDVKDLKIIAKATEVTRGFVIGPITVKDSKMAVIRSVEELVATTSKPRSAKDPEVQKAMTSALAKHLKVDAIDWSKQMVVVGIAYSVDSLKADGKNLSVTYTRYVERPVRAVPMLPKVLLLTDRFEGEVKFVPKDKEEKKE